MITKVWWCGASIVPALASSNVMEGSGGKDCWNKASGCRFHCCAYISDIDLNVMTSFIKMTKNIVTSTLPEVLNDLDGRACSVWWIVRLWCCLCRLLFMFVFASRLIMWPGKKGLVVFCCQSIAQILSKHFNKRTPAIRPSAAFSLDLFLINHIPESHCVIWWWHLTLWKLLQYSFVRGLLFSIHSPYFLTLPKIYTSDQ